MHSTPSPPTHQEHSAPLGVLGVQTKGLLEAFLGFGGILVQEAEGSIVQPGLDAAVVLSYSLDNRDYHWSQAQHMPWTGETIPE